MVNRMNNCINSYEELLSNCGCSTCTDISHELSQITNELVSMVNSALAIENQLCQIALEIANNSKNNTIPTEVGNDIICMKQTMNAINCALTGAANQLQSLICSSLDNDLISAQ